MTLQKALKEKKKLLVEISKHVQRMKQSNSREVGTKVEFDAVAEKALWISKVNSLIELKKKIYIANTPIAEKIFRLAELKGMIQTLKSLSTKEGKVRQSGYGASDVIEYEASITAEENNALIEEWEIEIEYLQDELDEYNAKTEI